MAISNACKRECSQKSICLNKGPNILLDVTPSCTPAKNVNVIQPHKPLTPIGPVCCRAAALGEEVGVQPACSGVSRVATPCLVSLHLRLPVHECRERPRLYPRLPRYGGSQAGKLVLKVHHIMYLLNYVLERACGSSDHVSSSCKAYNACKQLCGFLNILKTYIFLVQVYIQSILR